MSGQRRFQNRNSGWYEAGSSNRRQYYDPPPVPLSRSFNGDFSMSPPPTPPVFDVGPGNWRSYGDVRYHSYDDKGPQHANNRESWRGQNGNHRFDRGPRDFEDRGHKRRHDDMDRQYAPRQDNSGFNDSRRSDRSFDSRNSGRYNRNHREPNVPPKPAQFDKPFNSEEECTEDELRYYLGLTSEEVPVYVLRMRKMGPVGYPPALLDNAVRVSSTLPFLGDHTQIFTKRTLKASDMKPIKGFTHMQGDEVSEQFLQYMQRVADHDYEYSNDRVIRKARKAGLNLEAHKESEESAEKKPMETIRYEIPAYELSFDEGYAFGENTKAMKHNLDSFKDGIQPFVASEPNTPSNFMAKLKSIMTKEKKESSEEKSETVE